MKTISKILLIGLLISGCGTQKKLETTLTFWMGSTKHDLVMSWGAPTQTSSDGNGGEILTYANRVYYMMGQNTVDYWVYKMMYADASGKLYHWLYRKSPNPPERVDVRILSR